MKKIKRLKNMYLCFTKAGLKVTSTYKSDLIGYFIGESLYNIVLIYVWKCLYQYNGIGTMNGFTYMQMVLYLLLSGIISFMDETDSIFTLGEEIRSGDIVMRLIKPISLDKSILFFELGNKILMFLCVFVPSTFFVSVYIWFAYGVVYPFLSYFIFFVSMVLRYMISFYFNMMFGFLAFYLLNLWGVSMLKTAIVKFFSGQIIPLFLFSSFFEKLFSILPMAAMTYTPVMLFLGRYSGKGILLHMGIQIIWLLIFYFVCHIIWKNVQDKLMIQGG